MCRVGGGWDFFYICFFQRWGGQAYWEEEAELDQQGQDWIFGEGKPSAGGRPGRQQLEDYWQLDWVLLMSSLPFYFDQVKIENQKLDWNVTAKVSVHSDAHWVSIQGSTVSTKCPSSVQQYLSSVHLLPPTRGPVLDRDNCLFKVGSTVNMRHQAGGGDVKVNG